MMELKRLEEKNMGLIKKIYQSLLKDNEIQQWIEIIKSHKWIKVIEGNR